MFFLPFYSSRISHMHIMHLDQIYHLSPALQLSCWHFLWATNQPSNKGKETYECSTIAYTCQLTLLTVPIHLYFTLRLLTFLLFCMFYFPADPWHLCFFLPQASPTYLPCPESPYAYFLTIGCLAFLRPIRCLRQSKFTVLTVTYLYIVK